MPRRDPRIYVGNLPSDVRMKDIEQVFGTFGKITYIDLKNRRGPPFAFIEFEDARQAEDAITRDGYDLDGYKLRVEFPKGRERGPGGAYMSGTRDGRGDRSRGPFRRSKYRVIVSGLPPCGSWQDLKDHMRVAGDVCFADVYNDGTGVVEYARYSDMKNAIRKLNDSRFKSHEGKISYVRVKEDYRSSRSRSESRSSSRTPSHSSSRSRSRSRERSRSRSRSLSPSPSPRGRRSGSESRSRSRGRDRISSHDRSLSRRRSASRSTSRSGSPCKSSDSPNARGHRKESTVPSRRRSHLRDCTRKCRSRSLSRRHSRSRSPSPYKPKKRSKSRSRSRSSSVSSRSRSRSPRKCSLSRSPSQSS